MLKNDMQHQFWVTKKTVQRKLGGREDECVVSSDTELDLKLNMFESISTTTTSLYRVLDLYQERVSALALEESLFGKFLKEHGKLSQSSCGGSGKRMSTAGKAISYSAQQRMLLRSPLIRFHSELDTFRSCAVADTQATISAMERDRTEYRAALSWMKSITLDPENDRGIEKFRKAQQTVRSSKERFDRKSLDCLEKIDLLAAARCNLFSHVLVAYQNSLQVFASKTLDTFKVASKILENEPHYAFSILRDLTQAEKEPSASATDAKDVARGEVEGIESTVPEMKENAIDPDQLLFFQDDYTDTDQASTTDEKQQPIIATEIEAVSLISTGSGEEKQLDARSDQQSSILDALDEQSAFFLDDPTGDGKLINMDLAFLDSANANANAAPTDSLLDLLGEGSLMASPPPAQHPSTVGKSILTALSNKMGSLDGKLKQNKVAEPNGNKSKSGGKDMSSWFKLFSELDPLANPDAMNNQINASNSHSA